MTKEIWKDIEGYEGLYQVSTYGRVKSFRRGRIKIMTPQVHPSLGYVTIVFSVNKKFKNWRVSRLVYSTFVSKIPKKYDIDHIDHNSQNNRLNNLRLATHQENTYYQLPQTREKYSCFKGVSYSKDKNRVKRWRAYIKQNQKMMYLGRYHTEREAARAYNIEAKKLFGVFAYINKNV